MEPSDIETAPLAAVKNLRSKFEQLAAPNSPTLLAGSTPRVRASSGSRPNGDRPPNSPTLRPSNSASDLRLSRKPPPPPPARAKPSPTPSPTASPLLRPVPNGTADGSLGRLSGLATSVVVASQEEEIPSIPSVSSLRNLFVNSPTPPARPSHSPRPSINIIPFTVQSETDVTGVKRPPPPPPSRVVHETPPEDAHFPDPFSESDGDTEVSGPPSLPPRHQRRTSSQTSSEGDPPPVSRVPPPRPPPRQTKIVESPASLTPPPLPSRRSTVPPAEDLVPVPPRLPARPPVAIPVNIDLISSPASAPPIATERKGVGAGRLPPPPTRTIALGDKLPPPRRHSSLSSDEESGDEAVLTPDLPDSSRSSRRPPKLSFRPGYVGPSEPKITIPVPGGHAIVSGTIVVTSTNHHVRIYDLTLSDTPIYNLDKREMANEYGIKELKVSSMEYRPCAEPTDRGCILCIGTKDGHLVELDVRTGCVTAAKLSAHLHAVVRIFRHGRDMVTLDEGGKTLIWAPGEDGEDFQLMSTPPRVTRITEKQDFAQMICGKLWTASRMELHGARMQTLRVFDLFAPGVPARPFLPVEPVGAMLGATMLPSRPRTVYVGHEGGNVSVWALDADGWPRCLEIVRISTSDVLCLEGVHDRLWAGARNGTISAYDITVKPWLVTNCWKAHETSSVYELAVDHYGIEKTGRLCVASVGRDKHVKLWDGLLASDWVDAQLMKRESSFSTFRDLSVLIVSWNCDSSRPEALTGDPANINFLQEALTSVDCPDIISFGLQEVVDLESRKMVAKNIFLGGKDKADLSIAQITGLSGLSEKVTTAYRKWYDHFMHAVRLAMPAQVPYTVVHTESLVGLFTCILVKNSERMSVKDNVITHIKRGMGGRYGNKGGIITRLVIEDSSICFINCHLAAGQHAIRARNADVAAMLEEPALFPASENEPLAYVGGGDGQMILDHEIVFLNGDMNYRIDQRRENIIASVRAGEIESLYPHDQLMKEIKFNRSCRLRVFSEGPLTFPPTYKYDRNSSDYDSSEKARAPAWCDRVLWRTRTPDRVKQLHYRRYEVNVSDHRPISAAFQFTVKSIRHDVRQKAKSEVQLLWVAEEKERLSLARDFYVELALI
ncbi:Endonuclease/exonuclease/phosphatase [Roridomyces roridus]|uniref:Endonuclease/exonuclease/phosphatase n=1 Tax=Roridomyces roridus TaxID=1738132 RepID=A0AAD7FGB5_9AGAR|nr:Endonuclease/exonuclease/phosphatase [Roridomyces roridus]